MSRPLTSTNLSDTERPIDEGHIFEYFGGDPATTKLFLEVLSSDVSSGKAIAAIAKKYFQGDFDTARGFCALAAETKERVQTDERRQKQEEQELEEFAKQAKAALREKREARAKEKEVLRNREGELRFSQQSNAFARKRAVNRPSISADELENAITLPLTQTDRHPTESFNEPLSLAAERSGSLSREVQGSEGQTPKTNEQVMEPHVVVEEAAAVAAISSRKFRTKSVYEKAQDREKEVQRTMNLLRALESSRLKTEAGAFQMQDAMRPKSYTHELLKNAGLHYRRGKPVFEVLPGTRRSTSALSYVDNANEPLRFRAQGSRTAIVNRRSRSATPGDQAELSRPFAACEVNTSAINNGPSGIFRSRLRPKTLAPLAGMSRSSGGLEVESLSISLPVLCKIKSSETAMLTEATGEVRRSELEAELSSLDPTEEEPEVIAQKRIKASKIRMARRIAHGISNHSILLTTQATQSKVEQKIVKHDGEARDTMRRVENILGDIFGIDIRDHGIQIRVTDSMSEIESTLVMQKSKLNAHVLDCAPRAVCVKTAISLPMGMGRLLHNAAYYTEEPPKPSVQSGILSRPPADGLGRLKLPPMDHQRVKVEASVAHAHHIVHREVDEILVLRGMSSYQLAGEIAKAVGSAFLFLEQYDGLDAQTEGAFCELCSYLWAKEEKKQLMAASDTLTEKVVELEGELRFVESKLEVLQQHVQEAHREREEANEAELHARKTLSAARDAIKHGWPGAQRKMEAAKQAEMVAARELEEAIAAEVKVIGKEYPEALEEQRHVQAEFSKERLKLAEMETAISAYSMYMVTQENNPHPIYGEAFRKALLGYESVEGKMRPFLWHLKQHAELIQPRPKTKEELEAEAAEELRLQQEKHDREAEVQRDLLGTLFGRITDRLKAETSNLQHACATLHRPPSPGAPSYLRYEADEMPAKSKHPERTFDQEVLDCLDDKMRYSETGELTSSELAEYCAMTIRGEHDAEYCFQIGEQSLRETKVFRFSGDLEEAKTALARAFDALNHAGDRAKEHLHELEYLEKAITREWNQVQKAIYCHEKAEEAMNEGSLVVFRRYWNEAKSMYESCGAVAQKAQHLPALLAWDDIIKKQEHDIMIMSNAIIATTKAMDEGDIVTASREVHVANEHILICGKAGVHLTDKAQQLLQSVLKELVHQRKQQESLCKAAIVAEKFKQADFAILEIWKCCKLAAIAQGEVAYDADADTLISAERKQAKVQGSPVVSLAEELLGTKAQHEGVKILGLLDLRKWPDQKSLPDHKAKAELALKHFTQGRKHLEAAGTTQATDKVMALQPVELDLALRVHANDIVKRVLNKAGPAKESPNGAPIDALPFMCTAAAANNTGALELLIAADGDINLVDENKNTPVHHAVMARAWEALRTLGKNVKTNPNKLNSDDMTPLHLAVVGKAEVVKSGLSRLRHSISSVSTPGILKSMASVKNQADMQSYVEGVKILLSEFWKINPNVGAVGKYEATPLHFAAEMANNDAVDLLLKNSKTDPNAKDKRGRSPMMAGIWEKRDISLFLKNSRVSVNQGIPKTGWTPLHVCIIKNSLECMKDLLACDRVDVGAEDLQGYTPMHLALNSSAEAVDILMQSTAVHQVGGPKLMHLLASSQRFHAVGDPANRGLWPQVTKELLELLPTLLLELRMWEELHNTLCNVSFAASIVEHLGVDTAIALFASTCDQARNFPGVQQDMIQDFFQYQALLEKHSYEIRTAKTTFSHLAVEHHLWGVTNAQHTVAHIIELVDDIRGTVANKMKNEAAAFFGCLAYKTEMEIISKLSLQRILPSKRSFERATNFIKQIYNLSRSTMEDMDEHFQHIMRVATPEEPEQTIGEICSLMSLTNNQDEVGALKVTMKPTIDHSKIKSRICEALSSVVPNNEQHVLLRVARIFVHGDRIVAIVVLSKNPSKCASSFAEGRLHKTLNTIVDSFRGKSNDTRLKPVIEELKILSITTIDPSVFIVFDLVSPWTTTRRYQNKHEFASQVLQDVRNSCNLPPNLLRVCKISHNWNHVIIELLHDDVNTSKSLAKNRIIAERLTMMVYTPSTVLHKGAVTQHVASCHSIEGHVVPRIEGEWMDFKVHVTGSSMAMHNELSFLEQYILPATQRFASLCNCYVTYTIQHDDMMSPNMKKLGHSLHDMELHDHETEITIGLIGDRFGDIITSDKGPTSMIAKELQEAFLDCPDWKETFVYCRDLENVSDFGFPHEYQSVLSDKGNERSYELLRQLKTKLDKYNGRRTLHYKPVVKGYSLNLEYVLAEARKDAQKWEACQKRLQALRDASNNPDCTQVGYALTITQNRMQELVQSCTRWMKMVATEDKRGGVPTAVLDSVKSIAELPMFAEHPDILDDLSIPDLSEVRLSMGLHLDVEADMFHIGLAIVDSIRARSAPPCTKPPFHSHLHKREVLEILRTTSEENFCVEKGSALDTTLEYLESVAKHVLLRRVKSGSVKRGPSSLQTPEHNPSIPEAEEKTLVTLLRGSAGVGKSMILAILSQRLLLARFKGDPSFDVPNIQIYFKMTDQHTFPAALRFLHLELALQVQGKEALLHHTVHMGDWEVELAELKKQIERMPAGTSIIFLLDGFGVEHRQVIAEMTLSMAGKTQIQSIMCAEKGAMFLSDTIPDSVLIVKDVDGLSEGEQRQMLSTFGNKYHTRALTDAEKNQVVGKLAAQNPLYLLVYALACVIRPSWVETELELPDDAAKLFELFVIPFVSDWLRIPAKIIETVVEIAQMNPCGIRLDSMHTEVQGGLEPQLREDASISKMSMLIALLAPIWRPSRKVDGLIALEHLSLVSSLKGNMYISRALHLADGHLATKKVSRQAPLVTDFDSSTIDLHLMARLEANFRHRVELFNLRSTKPMFQAFSPNESWEMPEPSLDWIWASQVTVSEGKGFDNELIRKFLTPGEQELTMGPSESIVTAINKWCIRAEKVLNENDLHDIDPHMSLEAVFDTTYSQRLKTQNLWNELNSHDFVLASIGLQMATKIWDTQEPETTFVAASEKEACKSVSACWHHFKDIKARVARESGLLEDRCEELSSQLVKKYKDTGSHDKFLQANLKETLGLLVYDIVVDFRGQIEMLHRRGCVQTENGDDTSPWQLLSPAITRYACEELSRRLNDETIRISSMIASKRNDEFSTALGKLRECIDAAKIHEALDWYDAARNCGRYPIEDVDHVDPNNREDGLIQLGTLKNQLDKAVEKHMPHGASCVAFGPAFATEDSVVGIPTLFIIQSKTSKGEKLGKGGDSEGFDIKIEDEGGAVEFQLLDNGNGTYEVEFVPRYELGCQVSIAFRISKTSPALPLMGSPFTLNFRRDSFWSKKSSTMLPKNLPSPSIFAASQDVAFLLDVKSKNIFTLSPDAGKNSGTYVWTCKQGKLVDGDIHMDAVKGAFMVSGRIFVCYTEFLSQQNEEFQDFMFLIDIQENSNWVARPLLAFEQTPPAHIMDIFETSEWPWSSMSCRTKNKVEGIPELLNYSPSGRRFSANETPEESTVESAFSEHAQAEVSVTHGIIPSLSTQEDEALHQSAAPALKDRSPEDAAIAEQAQKGKFEQCENSPTGNHVSESEPSGLTCSKDHPGAVAMFRNERVKESFKMPEFQKSKSSKARIKGSSSRYEDFSSPIIVISSEEDSNCMAPFAITMTHYCQYSKAVRKRKSAIFCNGKLIVFGGCAGDSKIITCYKSDINSSNNDNRKAALKYETVTASGHIPCRRCNFFMAYDGKHIVLHGGIDEKDNILNDVYIYDIEHHRWDCILSVSIANQHRAMYAAGANGILSLSSGTTPMQFRVLDCVHLMRKNSLQMCGLFISETVAKVVRAIRNSNDSMSLRDSWILRCTVYRVLHRTDLEANLQNCSEMMRFLNMHIEGYELNLAKLQQDLAEAHQMHKDMMKSAKDLQFKLKKVPALEAPHGHIETCYRLRAAFMIKHDVAQEADFGLLSTGYDAAITAIQNSTQKLKTLKQELIAFEEQTIFFGVSPMIQEEKVILDEQIKELNAFKSAWTLYDKLFHWADVPIGDPRMEDAHIINDLSQELDALSHACENLLKSNIFCALHQQLEDCKMVRKFSDVIQLDYTQPGDSWRAIRILCSLSQQILSPPTLTTVLRDKIMQAKKVKQFIEAATQDCDAAMVLVNVDILRVCERLQQGFPELTHRSMYSETCFCEITSVLKKPLPVRSGMRFNSKAPRHTVDPETRDIIGKARMGKVKGFKELFERRPSLVETAVDAHGNNVLHVACSNGQLQVVKLIVQNEIQLGLLTRNKSGKSPLDLALEFKHQHVAKYLKGMLPSLTENSNRVKAREILIDCKVHGLRVDFTLYGDYPGSKANHEGLPYLRSGSHANFVSYSPVKIKMKHTSSRQVAGKPVQISAWFIVGKESGPWGFSYGQGFTEVTVQHSVDAEAASETKAEALECVPLQVNLLGEEPHAKVEQAMLSRGLKEVKVGYTLSEFMAEFASYSRRLSDLESIGNRDAEASKAKDERLLANALIWRDSMNRPVLVDGLIRGMKFHSICTKYQRDTLGRIVVTDGVERNSVVLKSTSEEDWRDRMRFEAVDDAVDARSNENPFTVPLSSASAQEFNDLTIRGQETLQHLTDEASSVLVEAIARGQTPLAYALRVAASVTSPAHEFDGDKHAAQAVTEEKTFSSAEFAAGVRDVKHAQYQATGDVKPPNEVPNQTKTTDSSERQGVAVSN